MAVVAQCHSTELLSSRVWCRVRRFSSSSLLPLSQLLARCPKLSRVDLSLNPLLSSLGVSAKDRGELPLPPVQALYDAFEGTQLAVLDLSCVKLSDSDANGLLESPVFLRLTKLFLRSNALHDDTAVKIAQLLPAASFQVLSLAGNEISNRGLGALAFAITSSRNLQTLDLEENRVRRARRKQQRTNEPKLTSCPRCRCDVCRSTSAGS